MHKEKDRPRVAEHKRGASFPRLHSLRVLSLGKAKSASRSHEVGGYRVVFHDRLQSDPGITLL